MSTYNEDKIIHYFHRLEGVVQKLRNRVKRKRITIRKVIRKLQDHDISLLDESESDVDLVSSESDLGEEHDNLHWLYWHVFGCTDLCLGGCRIWGGAFLPTPVVAGGGGGGTFIEVCERGCGGGGGEGGGAVMLSIDLRPSNDEDEVEGDDKKESEYKRLGGGLGTLGIRDLTNELEINVNLWYRQDALAKKVRADKKENKRCIRLAGMAHDLKTILENNAIITTLEKEKEEGYAKQVEEEVAKRMEQARASIRAEVSQDFQAQLATSSSQLQQANTRISELEEEGKNCECLGTGRI
ncbi:Cilia- and flagella-associated protein 44 [Bienertia sinuspersici]